MLFLFIYIFIYNRIIKLLISIILYIKFNNNKENEIDQDQIEKDIDFKELHNDNDIVKAFNYIVRRFPKGYPLASPVLRFPERSINKSKKIQNAKNNEIDNEHNSVKSDKLNTIIKPKVQAFEYFVKDRYEILFKSTPSIGLSDLFDELEKEWKNLSYEDKLPYILLEIKDVKRYYMDQCKISKERRVQSSQKIILKPKRIRRIKKKTQIQSQESSQQEKNENATLIVDSEGEQENDNNIISLKKNKSTSAQVNNNENIMGKNYDIESRNNTTLINNLDEMDDKYIDSDTSEEYLAFDDISRKFLFENYSENENSENKNEYNFDIQKIGLNKNKNKEKNETFIPVTNVDSNSPIKFSFSQDTIVYNSQNELNELSSNNFNENNSTLSNNEEIAGQMKNEKIIKSTPELIIDSNIDKSQSSVSPTIIQIPPTVIESSMKIATPLSSKFSSITNNDNNDKNNSSNNLETPKNSQSSKSLLKSLKPIRKSSSWRFGNDIDIIQRVSEEKVSFISNKSKDDESDEFDINNNSSSSSSSSSEEEEEEEIEENNENNIFLSKDKVSSNDKLSNNIKDNGNQASTPSNWNNKTTNTFNKLVFENSYVTPKKSGGKYKISYSSNKKKNNYYGIERRKYDLF
ncbi:hypothetical protein BCR36DRAFT_368114 [Piromyces finnis]|uniref:HMG box domain-containing protein n=1 Tax=Piromyces finnis TaxID=1754191 RepID=A0A1Y1VG82_9FUNG|nr:hypothetical protein BCR36DRAFT_368114 [Piromyces finnis]|eukprot:ORX55369.1 hypothetical protein BCR36DRAFT_368114 [Piromyces finnis]